MRFFLTAVAISWLIPAAFAVTVTLHPVADACLWEHDPDNNMGGDVTTVTGRTATAPTGRGRPLFQFDFRAIPTNAIINSAALTLRVTKVPSGSISSMNDLRRVLQPWGEGRGSGFLGSAALAN